MSSPLLWLHGFTGRPESFAEVVALLDEPERSLCEPLLGHHPTLITYPATGFEDEVDRLAARLRALSLGAIHLCGYSMGARVGLGLLVRHPDLFARATLVGAHPGLTSAAERAARLDADGRWERLLEQARDQGSGTDQPLGEFVRQWESQPLFATQARLPESKRSAERAARLAHNPAGLLLALSTLGLGRMPDYSAALERVRLPVDLLIGEEDEKFRAIAERLARALPEARITRVRGAGHNLILEAPRAVAARVQARWEEHR